MGGEPYWYYVEYEKDFNAALQKLREREFKAGRYNSVVKSIAELFPINMNSPCLGVKHDSIEEAMEASMEDGTRSILDLSIVSEKDDYCNARILPSKVLIKLFGTDKPQKEQNIENCSELWELIERGKGVCIPIYNGNDPIELLFMGYSFD